MEKPQILKRRSKYNFSLIKVGDTKIIEGVDKTSFQTALKAYNKRHLLYLAFSYEFIEKGSKFKVTRVS